MYGLPICSLRPTEFLDFISLTLYPGIVSEATAHEPAGHNGFP